MVHSLGLRFAMALALALTVTGTTLFILPPVQAQSVIGAVAVAGTARALLDDAERRVNQKLAEVENQANGLMAQAITGITMAIQSARINGDAVLDRPLDQLKATERAMLFAIRDAATGLDQLADKAYRLEEVTNVDASMLLGDTLLSNSATFISSIRGLSLLQTKPEHRITVIGTGLGPGRSNFIGNIEVWNGRVRLQPSRIDASQHNTTTLYFPAATFQPYYSPNKVVTLPLTVKLKTKRKRWLFLPDKEKQVDATTPFTLYPPLMGTARIIAEEPTFNWVATGNGNQPWTMRDCGNGACGGGGAYEERTATPGVEGNTEVVGYRRLVNAKCTCGEPWHAREACEYSRQHVCEIADNGKVVRHAWQVTGIWGTRTAHWTVETYQRTGTKPIEFASPVYYGQNLSFCIPSSVDYYRLELKTLTNETYQLVPQESIPGRLEHVASFTCNAKEKRVEYRVVSPL